MLHRELKLCQCCAWIFHPMLCQLSYSAPDLFFTILFFIGLPLSLNMRQWHPLKTSHPKVKLCSKTNQKTKLFSVRAAHSSHVMISFETNFCFDVIAALPPGKSFFQCLFSSLKTEFCSGECFYVTVSFRIMGSPALISFLHFCQGIWVSQRSIDWFSTFLPRYFGVPKKHHVLISFLNFCQGILVSRRSAMF